MNGIPFIKKIPTVYKKLAVVNPAYSGGMELQETSSVFLDLLRGISAQLVLIGHGLSFFQIYPAAGNSAPFLMQNFGVLVFFILSGFLISLTTWRKYSVVPGYRFSNFFGDRFVRIYSGFLPALLIILLIDLAIIHLNRTYYSHYDALDFRTFMVNVLMLQDFPSIKGVITGTSFGSGRVLWTIGIEWWFYLFFGWLFFFRVIKMPVLLKLAVLLILFWVPYSNLAGGRGNCLAIVWYLGVAAAFGVARLVIEKTYQHWLLLIAALLLFAWALRENNYDVYEPLIASFLTISIFALVKLAPALSLFQSGPLKNFSRFLSSYSFSLYLLHYSVIELVIAITGLLNLAGFIVSFLFANIVSFLFASVTELHHKRIRKWVLKKYKV